MLGDTLDLLSLAAQRRYLTTKLYSPTFDSRSVCTAGTFQKIALNVHVTLEFFMVVSEFFVKFVILWPIATRFVWLKVGATGCRLPLIPYVI